MSIQRSDIPSLQSLLHGIVEVPEQILVRNIVLDHRDLKAGDLFIARAGTQHKGSDFVIPAIEAGASAVLISESDYLPEFKKYSDLIIRVKDLHTVAGELISRYYHSPTKTMNVVGITGTNGKTSSCHFIAQALNLLGDKTAYIGTIGYGFIDQLETSTHTTPDLLTVHQRLAAYHTAGATASIMEVSSHALDQGRVAGVQFTQVGITNLTRDHLDYHKSMSAYAASKQQLFDKNPNATQLLNIDDAFGRELLTRAKSNESAYVTYSQFNDQADVYVKSSEFHIEGMRFILSTPWGEVSGNTSIIGRFNLSNLLLTVTSLGVAGYPNHHISRVLPNITAVSGRMEKVSCIGEPLVLIDYAHTPDALLQALSALNEHRNEESKLICVFGCGGDRDQGKRPLMAQVASGLADHLIITSDNPRSEDPNEIINQVVAGLTDRSIARVEADRAEAISIAITIASANDIVLIAGKGHEDYQEIMGQRHRFSDQKVARHYLDQRSCA